MTVSGPFKICRKDEWTLSVRADEWRDEFWTAIIDRIRPLEAAKHPQTLEIALPGIDGQFFLKVFHSFASAGAVKDLFRPSKALRALTAGEALTKMGFNVAPALAAGEERNGRRLGRSFIVTSKIQATALPVFLREIYSSGAARQSFRRKVDSIERIGREIRRFHDLGFVHGDLIPPNILVADGPGALRFFFFDNDRTRRYPRWFPQQLWKRNLVQLNRLPLPGISLQDRMRFLHSYLGRRKLLPRDVALARWFEQRTRQRRKECDAVDVSGGFRALMRWRPTVMEGQ